MSLAVLQYESWAFKWFFFSASRDQSGAQVVFHLAVQ